MVILAAPVSSFPPKAGVTNKWSEAEKIAGSAMNILGASEEPEGRVSGMIRANPVKICVRRPWFELKKMFRQRKIVVKGKHFLSVP